jgi:aspartyl-tRNA(Asn)/glutamyl-tRNA(Gln) amidotransferase subunit C
MVGRGYHGAALKSTDGPSLMEGFMQRSAPATRSRLPVKFRRCIGARPRARTLFRELWMPVDLNAVRSIARLARIAVNDAEAPHLQDEINAILKFVEALDAVDVEGVEPMTSVIPMRLPMREDVVTDGEIAPLVLANAPLTEDGFFLVPKVIE